MSGAGYYLLKLLISALLIVLISEIAKRSSLMAALIASLPVVSLLSFVWLYLETRDLDRIATLANDIVWLVIPSLVLFISLPLLFKMGLGFWWSLGLACALTSAAYLGMLAFLRQVGMTG